MKKLKTYDVVVIGGGPAGLAAAVSARECGIERILILERDKELGGILNQCIHNGFGLHIFKEELTGPEYADRYIAKVKAMQIEAKLNTMVLDIGRDKIITATNRELGMFQIQAKSIVLAMGCRERPRGALNIPGYRPAGIFTAGTAQRLVNMENYMPGKEIVILGSGDIGLIMARRMTLEGAKVKVVAELLPYSGGLKRNVVQCLNDYNIPLKLSHTVTDIHGKERISGVTIAKVDCHGKPIKGTEEFYSCDTLLLSVGLIPENELSRELGVEINPVTNGPVVGDLLETSVSGVFACGNVLHVHDLVDYVSQEAATAGRNAAKYVIDGGKKIQEAEPVGEAASIEEVEAIQTDRSIQKTEAGQTNESIRKVEPIQGIEPVQVQERISVTPVIAGSGVRYTVPSKINVQRMEERIIVRFRVTDIYMNCFIRVLMDDKEIYRKKRKIMVPSEMEEVRLEKSKLLANPELKSITIHVQKEDE